MPSTHPKVSALLDETTQWKDELLALRTILLDSGMSEEFKWHSPVYCADGRNIAIIWGFKEYAALGFFKGVLLQDHMGILEVPGDNSRSSRILKFTDTDRIRTLEPIIRAYTDEAISIEKAGLKVDFPKDDLEYPEELISRLDIDTEFRSAFEALTPGRRRGWILHFSGAKQSATRTSRIDKATIKILAGKGMNDR
ncbi:MAG: YdeI/OmpD-associated family protein [Paracoccus sp. (in: a-proteobacteria)]